MEITHPFHPWKGRRLVLATRKQNWGEDRVMFFDADGQLRSVPVGWTDADPPDARTEASAGQSFFRADDLLTLVALVDEIKSRHPGRRRRVK